MKNMLLVSLGGMLGCVMRYKTAEWMAMHGPTWGKLPLGTLLINVTGCLVIGTLAAVAEKTGVIGSAGRLFLFTGLLGGYTTFSAFGLETFTLLRTGELLTALMYAAGSVLAGLVAVALGFLAGNGLLSRLA